MTFRLAAGNEGNVEGTWSREGFPLLISEVYYTENYQWAYFSMSSGSGGWDSGAHQVELVFYDSGGPPADSTVLDFTIEEG